MPKYLLPWFLLGVGLFFVGMITGNTDLKLVAKAIPVVVLAISVWGRGRMGRTVGIGLALGAVGDVVLELGHFLPGLVAFLIGHLFYVAAFWREQRAFSPLAALPPLIYIAALLSLVLPGAGAFAGPIAVYGVVIGIMAWRATAWGNTLGIIGAYVFAFSDSVIAINKFLLPLSYGPPLIILTYWTAQFLIAASVPTRTE
jgi:alkenylglycerophosphocholine hydrolase